MNIKTNFAEGEWLAMNCADLPSDLNCQLVIVAPASQRGDLMEAAVAHAMHTHGHQDSPETRAVVAGLIKPATL